MSSCENTIDSTGNKCFKPVTVNNGNYCYCKNNPSTFFKEGSYKKGTACYDCSNKYTLPNENAILDNLNKMKATINITENIIKQKNNDLNNLYSEFKKKLQTYIDIQNLINETNYLISVEQNNIDKLQIKIKSREVDYINILKQNKSLETQLEDEITKINQLDSYRNSNI